MREVELSLSQQYIEHYGQGLYAVRNRRFAELLADHSGHMRDLKVFEFAGSGGFLAKEILLRVPKISLYHHSDGNTDMVNHAKAIIPARPGLVVSKIDMVQDFHEVEWGKYNAFVCANIEHLPNDLAIVKAMPSGALVLMNTPTYRGRWHHFHTPGFEDLMARYWRYVDYLEFDRIDKPHSGSMRRFYEQFLAMTKLPLADDLVKPDRKLIFIGRRK